MINKAKIEYWEKIFRKKIKKEDIWLLEDFEEWGWDEDEARH